MPPLPTNPAAPHRALILVRAEVHEVLPTGECSGRPVHKVAEVPLPLMVEGTDLDDCLTRLNATLKELNQQCAKTSPS